MAPTNPGSSSMSPTMMSTMPAQAHLHDSIDSVSSLESYKGKRLSSPTELEITQGRSLVVLLELLRAMRPKDWIKNSFVFAAAAFARDATGLPLLLNPAILLVVVGAFVLFCMAASAIYLINALLDIEKDRAHPKKCNRPLA